ncbi:MAG: PilW family protein [Rhodanobacter sp.]
MSERPFIRCGSVRGGIRRSGSPAGFTLIELMIAMLLGLIVIAGVVSVFLAGQQTYRTNQALGDVQDGSRIAFEIMANDIRHAGLLGCSNNGQVANVLNNGPGMGGTAWWANWGNALRGYGAGSATPDPQLTVGTATGQQLAGTDSLMLLSAADSGLSIASNNQAGAQFTLNQTSTDMKVGDVMIVCDPHHAAIFKVTSYTPSSKTLNYAYKSDTTGNCSTGLGFPSVCTPAGNAYTFGANSPIVKLAASDWYIGNNGLAGGRSLYRLEISTSDGTAAAQEMVRDVTAMNIKYHQSPQAKFVPVNEVTDWSKVDAAQVTLTVQSTDKRVGTDAKSIQRIFAVTSTARNRVN